MLQRDLQEIDLTADPGIVIFTDRHTWITIELEESARRAAAIYEIGLGLQEFRPFRAGRGAQRAVYEKVVALGHPLLFLFQPDLLVVPDEAAAGNWRQVYARGRLTRIHLHAFRESV